MLIMMMEELNVITDRERITEKVGWRWGLGGKCLNLVIPNIKD